MDHIGDPKGVYKTGCFPAFIPVKRQNYGGNYKSDFINGKGEIIPE
jgi:hypothetical protein